MGGKVLRGLRIALWALLGLIGVALIALLLILQLWPSDSYRFLGGRKPILAGQMGPVLSNPSGLLPALEYRIYSWKQDFESVKTAAGKELATLGFELVKWKKPADGYASWNGPRGSAVMLHAGRSRTREEAFGGNAPHDPAWVTVICGNGAPDNWITHVRIAFEPQDY